jgi:hypothetical protein
VLDGVDDEVAMGAGPKLVEDVRTVSFDGPAGDVELLADLLTGVARRNKLEHFDLPLGEAIEPAGGWHFLPWSERVGDGEGGADEHVTVVHGPDAGDHLAGARALNNVAFGSQAQRFGHVGFLGVHGEDQQLGVG